MTRAKVKDCIANEKIIFIVEENEMGKAIGKNGINTKKMERILKKKIKLVEFSNDVLQFIKNIIYPIEVLDVKEENGIVTIYENDAMKKAILIGRDKQNINHTRNIVKRYFDVKEIRII
jgi:N utilization substance protein A